ncbi:MAG: tautomerase family protein [Candidatus Midichloria sp.]|nr:tautomerase family protein [Candidatus Midichloria sp.]
MPIINIHMLSGRTNEQKRALVRAVTDAVTSTLMAKERKG